METRDELGIHLGVHEDSDNRRAWVVDSSISNNVFAIFYNSVRNQTIQKRKRTKETMRTPNHNNAKARVSKRSIPRNTNRSVIMAVKTPCRCGGRGMLQQGVKLDSKGNFERFAVVFCQDCDYKTSTHSSSKDGDYYTQEALNEWNLRNLK